ncbi:MAG: hypothetical protein C0404_08410 [Verrucomicrobia bacterium]|nr:hypothetical protein [Verrucomicrobiota bacterium]
MGQNGTSDKELLGAYVEHHDDSAFEQLYARYVGFVHSICLKMLHDSGDAEDATMACFVLLNRKAPDLRDSARLSLWLHSCAVNTSLNCRRVKKNRAAREQEAHQMNLVESEAGGGASEELQLQLDEGIAGLPKDQREALILHFYERLSRSEIAEETGCAEGTVASRIAAGVAKLRKRLLAEGHTIDEDALIARMSGLALLMPMPHALAAGFSAILKARAASGMIEAIAGATARGLVWSKILVVAGSALIIVMVVAIPVSVKLWPLQAEPSVRLVAPEAMPVSIPSADTTGYVEGEIIFKEDFEKPTDEWDVVGKAPGDDKYVPLSPEKRKYVYGTTIEGLGRGSVTKAVCVEIPKTDTLLAGIRRKRPLPTDTYRLELDVRCRARESEFRIALPGCSEVRMLAPNTSSEVGAGWYRWQMECVPATGKDFQGFYDVKTHVGDKLVNHCLAKFQARDLLLVVEKGWVAIDNVVVRELTPVLSSPEK